MYQINADLLLNLHYCKNINESRSHLTNARMYNMLFTFKSVNFIEYLTNNTYMWLINALINAQCRPLKTIKE